MPSYLQKRRQLWYAVLEIPAAAQPLFQGKRRFIKSLETDSRVVAQRRVAPLVASWRSEIAQELKANGRDAPEDDAAFYRRRLRRAESAEEKALLLEQIDMAAWDVGAATVANEGDRPSSSQEAKDFVRRATAIGFADHLDEWLDASRVSAKTKHMQRTDVERFTRKFPTMGEVKRPQVRRWVNGLMNGDGNRKPKTVQRILSALRGYWRYLQTINVAGEDDEPFAKLDVARQAKRDAPKAARLPFAPADVLKLLEAATKAGNAGDGDLADLIRLGMWTGCRIEELCALKVGQVKSDHFTVADAKTAAGLRDVPIHPKLAQTMARLVDGKTETDYVLSGLSAKSKYGTRGNAIGKKFGRLKTELGFGPQHVFHSIRKTVVTILENAGVPENVVADIVGHEKPTMTYGLYSGGTTLAVKADALGRLSY